MNTLKFGNGEWYGKKDTILAYNDENSNFKPLAFSFDRASSATVINKEGLIETVGSGEPRIDYKDDSKGALLLEPARTNYLLQSNQFDTTWTNTNTTVTSGQVGVGGSSDAWKVDISSAFAQVEQTVSNNGVQTFSVYAKAGTLNWIRLRVDHTSFSGTYFDLQNGQVGSTVGTDSTSIENLGNGWYRCTIVVDDNVTRARIYPASANNDLSATSGNIYIQNAQLEQGSYATSYIPTSGGAVTRVAESCLKDNINTSIINSSYPFSMYAESTYVGGNPHVLSFSKRVVPNNYYVISISGNNEILLDARANGSTELIQSGVTLVDGEKFKVAITMESATSGKICVNGNTVVSKTNFSNQAVNNEINDLLLGQLRISSDTGNRLPITDARLYNTALTDQELINLTTI